MSQIIFKNMAHVGSFSNFIFVFVFVFVTGASVDSTSCELTVDPDFWRGRAGERTKVFQEVLVDLKSWH